MPMSSSSKPSPRATRISATDWRGWLNITLILRKARTGRRRIRQPWQRSANCSPGASKGTDFRRCLMKRLLSNDDILSRGFSSFPSPTRGEGKTHRVRKINLDSILLICPSCQCVAAVELDREGKSAAYFLPSRALEEGRIAIVTDVGAGSDGRKNAIDEQRLSVRQNRVVLTPRWQVSSSWEAHASWG